MRSTCDIGRDEITSLRAVELNEYCFDAPAMLFNQAFRTSNAVQKVHLCTRNSEMRETKKKTKKKQHDAHYFLCHVTGKRLESSAHDHIIVTLQATSQTTKNCTLPLTFYKPRTRRAFAITMIGKFSSHQMPFPYFFWKVSLLF
jgi:hypothetical protein